MNGGNIVMGLDKAGSTVISHKEPAIVARLPEYRNLSFRKVEKLKESLFDLAAFLKELSRFIDIGFVFEQAPKYGIATISFDDPDHTHCHPDWYEELFWKDGSIAKLSRNDSSPTYTLYLNPRLDQEAAAALIKRRTGLRIRPEEVYYYAWFHECGHTHFVLGNLDPGRLHARALFLNQRYTDRTFITEGSLRMLYYEAERKADEWAKAEFRKWRRSRRCLMAARKLKTVSLLTR